MLLQLATDSHTLITFVFPMIFPAILFALYTVTSEISWIYHSQNVYCPCSSFGSGKGHPEVLFREQWTAMTAVAVSRFPCNTDVQASQLFSWLFSHILTLTMASLPFSSFLAQTVFLAWMFNHCIAHYPCSWLFQHQVLLYFLVLISSAQCALH